MKISLKKAFLNEGYFEEINVDLPLCDFADDLFPVKKPTKFSGKIKNSAGVVSLDYRIEGVIDTNCARCYEPISRAFSEDFHHIVVESLSSDDDEADFVVLMGHEIDLAELVTGDLILTLPYRFFCKEDCKGLCPICGKNLNFDTCSCQKQEINTRQKLRGLSELLNNQ